MSPLELAAFRPWKDVLFTGNLWSDYFSYQQVLAATLELKENNYSDAGIRVFFDESAHYGSLIYTLDKISTADILAKRVHYWLDIRHQPTTVYAFTSRPLPTTFTKEVDLGYLLSNDVIEYTPPIIAITFRQRAKEAISPLLHPDWRNTTLLLLLLALLSAIRLYRQHHTS